MTTDESINSKRLLWAGFVAILAAGVGFGVRGGLFNTWAETYNFTGPQLGAISLGAGFISFCFGIIIGGVVVDKIGYGKLVMVAFALHVLSAVVTFIPSADTPGSSAYHYLYWGTFLFGLANGTLEAVANPLVSRLFPQNRNHYLNILHASWPAGMVIGGVIGWTMGDVSWKIQLGLFLVPTLVYGFMFFGQKFPRSEASEKGLKMGEMFKDIGLLGTSIVSLMLYAFLERDVFGALVGPGITAQMLSGAVAVGLLVWVGVITNWAIGHWLIFVLFILHAMVGSVELGTDGWIQNITGAILTPKEGKILFVVTSMAMFFLRFGAHTIESKLKLNPISLLLVCSILACVGLNAISAITSFGPAIGAVLIYALGKTFFWPTMLAVVGDRFPHTGAVAMSFMGGIGMLSVGLLGGPGLGYARDRFAAEELNEADPALYEKYQSAEAKSNFFFVKEVTPIDPQSLEEIKGLDKDTQSEDQAKVIAADIEGNRRTLRADSVIPFVMAFGYLFLFFYFRGKGGYRPLTIEEATGNGKGAAR